jgi:predicted RNA-binding protein associated with RNAse of E/G family
MHRPDDQAGPPSDLPRGFVDIHYHRLPDRLEIFRQQVVEATPDRVITFLPSTTIRRPLVVDGRVVLEPGSPVVWFTYPGEWYDIGRFHLADGTFTGIYANVLTPVELAPGRWSTTDLCLDVWVAADGSVSVLDEEDLREAEGNGWIDPELADTARRVAARLAEAARESAWPPAHVHEWTLERVRKIVGY